MVVCWIFFKDIHVRKRKVQLGQQLFGLNNQKDEVNHLLTRGSLQEEQVWKSTWGGVEIQFLACYVCSIYQIMNYEQEIGYADLKLVVRSVSSQC